MLASKYGNILTIILVIVIVAILVGTGFLVYNYVIKPNNNKRNIEAIAEFDKNVEETQSENPTEEENPTITPTESTGTPETAKKKTYYNGFVMVGYITIPKTNVKQPILDVVTPKSLDTAVAVLYPSNPQLNQPGNVVIVGHNYRNGQFFSNNKKLSTGDKVKIKDTTGTELTYTIYEIFETTEQDTSFYSRNTNGAIEVTLSTCTDDTKARTIILARVE
ncbi:MAG: sortase [Clostridia bacterium]|nr:sortase [Clostridia bacterium]